MCLDAPFRYAPIARSIRRRMPMNAMTAKTSIGKRGDFTRTRRERNGNPWGNAAATQKPMERDDCERLARRDARGSIGEPATASPSDRSERSLNGGKRPERWMLRHDGLPPLARKSRIK